MAVTINYEHSWTLPILKSGDEQNEQAVLMKKQFKYMNAKHCLENCNISQPLLANVPILYSLKTQKNKDGRTCEH